MSALLNCSNLGFAYGKQKIIKDVALSFDKKQFVGLIGPNGAGKSTLLKLLMGLIKPTHGQVTLAGLPLKKYKQRDIARHISLVPQDTSIDCAFSVKEVVAMGRNPHLGPFQSERKQDLEHIHAAMEKTDLLQMAERKVDQLSGGERQRVFIARAIAQQTPILLLDEPTANLDLCHQLEVLALAKELAESGHTAIAAIHDLGLASRFCDRLVLLSQGEVVADGTPAQVLTQDNLYRYFSIEAQIEPSIEAGESIRVTALKPATAIDSTRKINR